MSPDRSDTYVPGLCLWWGRRFSPASPALTGMLNTATLLFARQPLAYARGSVPHPFGAGPRGHPVRERMRNYLWRSLLTNANYEERIPFAQGHGVPRVAPSNKRRIGFVCPKTVLRHPPTHQHPALPYRGITGSTNAKGCCDAAPPRDPDSFNVFIEFA